MVKICDFILYEFDVKEIDTSGKLIKVEEEALV
jgi:hypothetical protein